MYLGIGIQLYAPGFDMHGGTWDHMWEIANPGAMFRQWLVQIPVLGVAGRCT